MSMLPFLLSIILSNIGFNFSIHHSRSYSFNFSAFSFIFSQSSKVPSKLIYVIPQLQIYKSYSKNVSLMKSLLFELFVLNLML